MISIIFTILSPLLILIGFLQVKRNGGFSVFNKRLLLKQQGIICHQCSFERELLPGTSYIISRKKPPGAWLCKSCTRQSRIVEIDNSFKFISRRISEFLISKNFQKLGSFFIFSALFCVVLQVILYFFDIKVNLSVISNMILSIYWTLLILRQSIVFK